MYLFKEIGGTLPSPSRYWYKKGGGMELKTRILKSDLEIHNYYHSFML